MAGDLNLKKSWNPALVKNQQKVWELEQKKLKELKESKEKNAEFKKEQEYLDLLKLQYGENFSKDQLSSNEKLRVSKLNWMYEDVPFEKQETEMLNSGGFIETTAEFTEGKTEAENLLSGNRAFKKHDSKGFSNDRMNKVIGLGSKKPSANSYGDDPLALIQKQQIQHRSQNHKSKSNRQAGRSFNDASKSLDSGDQDYDKSKYRSSHRPSSSSGRHRHHSSRDGNGRYSDDTHEYRHVMLPKNMLKVIPQDYFNPETGTLRILLEEEWRGLGITQSLGWVHYETHAPEPHILLFKRSINYGQ
ncbi:CWC25 [Candida margitis]|uniref:CWC25 n=1 Tax=Candida margitis TaxID=1775924 RepID=UPI00222777B3|nr:CWC25 [Candida margitis]KAI5970832.1 CWC25 [Candida margitis]